MQKNTREMMMSSAAAGIAALLLGSSAARAELVSYTINPAQSTLTVSGTLTGNTAGPQTTGSTTTSYTGTIIANRSATKIEFPGGSLLDAGTQSVNQQPRNDGTPGSQPADYGRTAPGPFSTTAFEALRNVQLDVFDDTSGTGITISGNNFASNSLALQIDNGESDTIFGLGGNPDLSLAGKGTANSNGNGASSVVLSGGIETLTLKFSTGAISYNVSQNGDSSLIFTGTIVATRAVPEPASVFMLGGAGLAMLVRRRR